MATVFRQQKGRRAGNEAVAVQPCDSGFLRAVWSAGGIGTHGGTPPVGMGGTANYCHPLGGYFSLTGVPGMIWGHAEVEKPPFFLGACNLTCKDNESPGTQGGTTAWDCSFLHSLCKEPGPFLLPNQTDRRWSWELNSGPP